MNNKQENRNNIDWLRKHADTLVIMSGIVGSILWMNTKFNDVDRRFSELEKDMAIVKTVLIMKNICPSEILTNNHVKDTDMSKPETR